MCPLCKKEFSIIIYKDEKSSKEIKISKKALNLSDEYDLYDDYICFVCNLD